MTNYQNLKGIELDRLSAYYPELPKNTPAYVLDLGGDKIYWSYETIIAVRVNNKLFIRENDWSTTTGRHLNAIDPDKSKRMSTPDFEQLLIDLKIKLYIPDTPDYNRAYD